jgi:ElaB/YqjD/DUF883 family membrane-anchored ribosome-binding protein
MSDDNTLGPPEIGRGSIESFASRKVARGKAAADARIEQTAGKIQGAIGQAASKATAAVSRVSGQAKEAYGRASVGAQKVADTVEPFVQERPYAALGIALGAGVVLGLLLAGRGPKVIYVRNVA